MSAQGMRAATFVDARQADASAGNEVAASNVEPGQRVMSVELTGGDDADCWSLGASSGPDTIGLTGMGGRIIRVEGTMMRELISEPDHQGSEGFPVLL